MAPLPKRKYPKSRQGKRRSHIHLNPAQTLPCPQCGTPRLPHHACLTCGNYKGREAIEVARPNLNE